MKTLRAIDLHGMLEDTREVSSHTGRPRIASVTAFDPSGKFLAIGLNDRVTVHELSTGARVEEYELCEGLAARDADSARVRIAVSGMTMSPDGRLVVCVEIGREDLGEQRDVVEVFDRRSGALRFRVCARDGIDATISTRNAVGEATRAGCSAWALSADGARLAIGDFDGSLRIVDALSGETIRDLTRNVQSDSYELLHPSYRRPVRALAFDTSGEMLGVARWVSLGYRGEYEVGLVAPRRDDPFLGTMRHRRELPIEDDIRVFGVPLKMACVGEGLMIAHDEERDNVIELVHPTGRHGRRWTRLHRYRVLAMSQDGARVLCMRPSTSSTARHAGLQYGRMLSIDDERYQAYSLEELDVRSLQEQNGTNGTYFSGGTLSYDGENMALVSEDRVVIGPCLRSGTVLDARW